VAEEIGSGERISCGTAGFLPQGSDLVGDRRETGGDAISVARKIFPASTQNMISAPPMAAREWTLLGVLSLLWGCSFFYFKVLVAELPTFTIVWGRVAIASLSLNVLLFARREPIAKTAGLWTSFAIMGLLNNILPFALIVWGETRISSGLASILNATTPIFAVLAAQYFTRNEKLNWHKGIGVACGFLGVVMLIGPSVLALARGKEILGELACLGAAMIYAAAGIYGRRFKGVPALHVATGQLTASTLLLVPLVLLIDQPWTLHGPSVHAWAALLALAVLSTAVAYVIYFRILAVAGATNVLLVTFLVPVSAILLGVLFLDETFTWRTLAGMVLIGLGLAAIDGRLLKALQRWLPRRAP
jgi:drug/metabolite transporter (DMT)-like permease